jgi:single-strand DNA-binding protein
MRGINKVILLGRATRDTEQRQTSSGKAVANLRVATNRVVTTATGERQEHPQFHTVVCFDRLAETTARYVGKGRLVYVEGRLDTRTYTDTDGHERQTTEIIASDVQFLDRPGQGAEDLPAGGDEAIDADRFA